jgi:hypothetical protein
VSSSHSERSLAEARLSLADTSCSARDRAKAILTLCRIDYVQARALLRSLPRETRTTVLATSADIELEFDRYTRHWLAAVAPYLRLDTEVLSELAKNGYEPQWSLALPPGYTTYCNPSEVLPQDQWLTLPPPTQPRRRILRKGDIILVTGAGGLHVVIDDIEKADTNVSFIELGYRLNKPYPVGIALRREVHLKHELPPFAEDPGTLFANFLQRRRPARA